jgi:hypothetical protein
MTSPFAEKPLTPIEVAARKRARLDREARKRALREEDAAKRQAAAYLAIRGERGEEIDESPMQLPVGDKIGGNP